MAKKIIKADKTPRRIETRHRIAENNSRPRIITGERVGATKVFSSNNYRAKVTEWIRNELGTITKDNFTRFISLDYLTRDSEDHIEIIKETNRLLKESIRDMIRVYGQLKFVDASFNNLYTVKDVYVKRLPPDNDPNLHFCNPHLCVIPDDNDLALEKELKVIFVPYHWRRSIEGVFRNFYGEEMQELLGQPAIADVTVQIKTDLATEKKSIVLNYRNIRPASSGIAKRSLKIGAPRGQTPIPGTDKFIQVDWIKKLVRKQKVSETSVAEC